MKLGREFILGSLFFVGLTILILATVFFSTRRYGATEKINIYFEQALGLRPGDPVLIAGVNEGFVDSILLLNDANLPTDPDARPGTPIVIYRTKVESRVRSGALDSSRVYKSKKIFIEYASVLGGRVVAIEPGKPEINETGVRITASVPLFGSVRRDPLAALSDLIEENKDNVREAITEIRDTFKEARTGQGLLGKLIHDPAVAAKFEKIVSDIQKTTDDLASARGALGKAISDPVMAANLERIVNNINSVSEKLNSGEGPLGRLINDATIANRISQIIADINDVTRKLNSTEGSIGKLINSSEAHDGLMRIEQKIENVLDQINNGGGLLSRIIHDKEMGDEAKALIHNANDVVATIARGEGTLGKLVKDDQLIRGLERVVRQISRSIEDAREAAPIATFSSVLFGAF